MEDDSYYDSYSFKIYILVKFLFEVFCVVIYFKKIKDGIYFKYYKVWFLYDGNLCEIYGMIWVFDENGNKFDFYNGRKVILRLLILVICYY